MTQFSDAINQFTELHDKNGKEIYEGDILRGNCYLYVVSFQNGAFDAEILLLILFIFLFSTVRLLPKLIGIIFDKRKLRGRRKS